MLQFLLLLVTHLVIPIWFIVSLWRARFPNKVAWLIRTLAYGAFLLFMVLGGAGWSWVSYYFRILLPLAFLGAAFVSYRRVARANAPWWSAPGCAGDRISLAVSLLLLAPFAAVAVTALGSRFYDRSEAVELAFPLRDGVYQVVHGGSTVALNYHAASTAQHYALDIVRLNAIGTRVLGIYPPDPTQYAAWGSPVYSPCTGDVLSVEARLPDHRPPDTDRERPAGNHVVVRCPTLQVDVLLAHLMEGSIAVEAGEPVEEGQLLGRVGNSGNTSEPHLHIHAVRTGSGSALDGEGVPLVFDGRFLVRNSLVIR